RDERERARYHHSISYRGRRLACGRINSQSRRSFRNAKSAFRTILSFIILNSSFLILPPSQFLLPNFLPSLLSEIRNPHSVMLPPSQFCLHPSLLVGGM